MDAPQWVPRRCSPLAVFIHGTEYFRTCMRTEAVSHQFLRIREGDSAKLQLLMSSPEVGDVRKAAPGHLTTLMQDTSLLINYISAVNRHSDIYQLTHSTTYQQTVHSMRSANILTDDLTLIRASPTRTPLFRRTHNLSKSISQQPQQLWRPHFVIYNHKRSLITLKLPKNTVLIV
jgi:hypothetical protein